MHWRLHPDEKYVEVNEEERAGGPLLFRNWSAPFIKFIGKIELRV